MNDDFDPEALVVPAVEEWIDVAAVGNNYARSPQDLDDARNGVLRWLCMCKDVHWDPAFLVVMEKHFGTPSNNLITWANLVLDDDAKGSLQV